MPLQENDSRRKSKDNKNEKEEKEENRKKEAVANELIERYSLARVYEVLTRLGLSFIGSGRKRD